MTSEVLYAPFEFVSEYSKWASEVSPIQGFYLFMDYVLNEKR